MRMQREFLTDFTEWTGGTGLGLAIVKRIVEIHNGKIEVDSKMNEGTEISIVLPIGDAVVNSQEEINKNINKEKIEKKKSVFGFLKKKNKKSKKK